MLRRKLLTVLAASAFLAAFTATPASAKPNFSGTWKMLADKSDYGPLPMPEKYEQTVDHSDPDVKVKVKQVGQSGEIEFELSYHTEGQETTNSFRGNPMKSIAKWDGEILAIESKLDYQGNEIILSDKWTLSEDGKIVTISRKLATPQGDLEQKIVLEKQ